MRRRHAISLGFSGHYQDLGIASLKGMVLPAILFKAWVYYPSSIRSSETDLRTGNARAQRISWLS